jgi:hypothetical protein
MTENKEKLNILVKYLINQNNGTNLNKLKNLNTSNYTESSKIILKIIDEDINVNTINKIDLITAINHIYETVSKQLNNTNNTNINSKNNKQNLLKLLPQPWMQNNIEPYISNLRRDQINELINEFANSKSKEQNDLMTIKLILKKIIEMQNPNKFKTLHKNINIMNLQKILNGKNENGKKEKEKQNKEQQEIKEKEKKPTTNNKNNKQKLLNLLTNSAHNIEPYIGNLRPEQINKLINEFTNSKSKGENNTIITKLILKKIIEMHNPNRFKTLHRNNTITNLQNILNGKNKNKQQIKEKQKHEQLEQEKLKQQEEKAEQEKQNKEKENIKKFNAKKNNIIVENKDREPNQETIAIEKKKSAIIKELENLKVNENKNSEKLKEILKEEKEVMTKKELCLKSQKTRKDKQDKLVEELKKQAKNLEIYFARRKTKKLEAEEKKIKNEEEANRIKQESRKEQLKALNESKKKAQKEQNIIEGKKKTGIFGSLGFGAKPNK